MNCNSSNQLEAALAKWTSETVIAELEDAMTSLQALPNRGFSPRLASLRLEIPAENWPSEQSEVRLRLPTPTAENISRMDRTLRWLGYIPDDRRVLRKIVGLRAVTHFESGKPLSWRKVAKAVGADPIAVKTWHAAAIEIIVRRLNAERLATR